MEKKINCHYGSGNLQTRIFTALEQAGKDPDRLALKDLSTIDQLHTGGHRATLDLAGKTGLPAGAVLLDAGCGIGGSSRLLAAGCGFTILGMDLVEGFIDAAVALSSATNTGDSVSYRQGNVLATGIENAALDGIWCQHTLMNIPDKAAAFSEFFRILKPGGLLILHEITRGDSPRAIDFPVPWADVPGLSHLIPWPEMADLLEQAGFCPRMVEDRTRDQAMPWWTKVRAAFARKGMTTSPLGPHILFGKNGLAFGRTMSANLEDDRIRLIETIWTKPD